MLVSKNYMLKFYIMFLAYILIIEMFVIKTNQWLLGCKTKLDTYNKIFSYKAIIRGQFGHTVYNKRDHLPNVIKIQICQNKLLE